MSGGVMQRGMPNALARLAERHGPSALQPRGVILFVFWALLAAAALAEGLAQWLAPTTFGASTFRSDRWLLALWALAAPAILYSAQRLPVRGLSDYRRALLHGLAATLFIVAANVLIRLPLLSAPTALGMGAVGGDLARGLARFYPAALLLYAALVALGSRAWGSRPPSLAEHPTAATAESSASAVPTDVRAERVVVREWNRVHLVRPTDIAWIESDDNNVVVHAAGRVYKGRGRISDLAAQLDPTRFVRVHRSAIVHVTWVREVQPLPKGDLALVLRDGKVLRVARSRRDALVTALALPL